LCPVEWHKGITVKELPGKILPLRRCAAAPLRRRAVVPLRRCANLFKRKQ